MKRIDVVVNVAAAALFVSVGPAECVGAGDPRDDQTKNQED